MRIKIDKSVCMNFLHSFFGGIFGGIVVAFSLGQTPQKETLGHYLVFLVFIVVVALLGIYIMGFLNYRWEHMKNRTPKKKAK